MDKIIVRGGRPLNGSVTISGMKNAALPIVFASIITGEECIIENIPKVDDVMRSLEIIREMGAEVEFTDIFETTVRINAKNLVCGSSPDNMVNRIRGSIYLAGAEVSRFGRSRVALPGGCNFGERPIDQHIKAFKLLGAEVETDESCITCGSEGRLKGANICFDIVSVGATINAMIVATLADGITILENAAREPHIVDLANFLNSMGANIMGAGTGVIRIRGVDRLHGTQYSIIPDQIEAGTYMVAAAATGGDVMIENVTPKHLESIIAKLSDAGAKITEFDEAVRVRMTGRPHACKVKTMPHPGFPTDMQPQMATLLSVADGTSLITEGVWESRFRYVDQLSIMGANIQVDGKSATVTGVERLHSAPVRAVDLRAGAAMIIAGLMAKGETTVEDISHIERGYELVCEKLTALGADIKRINDFGEPAAKLA